MTDKIETQTFYRMMVVKISSDPSTGGEKVEMMAPAWDNYLTPPEGSRLQVVELNFEVHLSKLKAADPITVQAMGGTQMVFDRSMIESSVQGAQESDPDGGLYRTMILYKSDGDALAGAKDEMVAARERIRRRFNVSMEGLDAYEDMLLEFKDRPIPALSSHTEDGWEAWK